MNSVCSVPSVAKHLLIRADAGPEMGTGHVMRCIALAQAWQDIGGNVTFLTSRKTAPLESRLKSESINIVYLRSRPGTVDDALETADLVQLRGVHWVVADGYHFGSDYQWRVRESRARLLLIDDYGHADHYYADIVLNQNIHASEGIYKKKESYTRLLLRTKYALLRREFAKWRDWKREIPEMAGRILVTLGGSDPQNATLEVIRALNLSHTPDMEVRIVLGPSNMHEASLVEAVHGSRFTVHRSVENMPELMAWADLAVSAGGSTCWELAYLGLPCLVLVLTENQRGIAEGLDEFGTVVNLGRHQDLDAEYISEQLSKVIRSAERRKRMSQLGITLVDGHGSSRVVKQMRNVEYGLQNVKNEYKAGSQRTGV